ncbi:hypothetical protein GN958_ATG13841 [Phytophthora infestans]|uniref:Uncharacterized protein n=1 Tax=Phytophthora infestans TaxID=4787 RepID=A0A8S9UBV2_PHYIN|nr:hypothetical protein GN958_ATG13841 [Phytophthora infestans]
MNMMARDSDKSDTSGSEPVSPTSGSVTHAATRWLEAMNESDASGDEIHAAVVAPRVRKELHIGNSGEKVNTNSEKQCLNGKWQPLHKRETDVASAAPKKRAKRKHRKSTIDTRKEEIANLLKELSDLHTRMEKLNSRAMEPSTASKTMGEAGTANRVLRRAIQKQQLKVTQFHALMSVYSLFSTRVGSPIHQETHLLNDTESRLVTLTATKDRALELGARFLKDRCPRINPYKSMREDHGYEGPNGDYYTTYFSTYQLENSVKNVFDILLGYFSSIEICVSEKLGNITVREVDDNLAPDITQNRLITTTIGGLRMESSTVYFSHFEEEGSEPGHENGYGLFVADFIDEDDRNPYHPHERIRRDFSAVLELTSYPIQQCTSKAKTPFNDKEGRVVVVTRWVHSRVHHPQYEIPLSGWHEMRENTERWVHTLHQTMLERNWTLA